MSAETAIVAWLQSDGPTQDATAGRIFPEKIPQGETFPCVTYMRLDGSFVSNLNTPANLAHAKYRLSCFDLTYAGAKTLALGIKGTRANPKFHGYQGTPEGQSTRIQVALLEDMVDVYHQPVHGDDQGAYETALDFEVWYEDV